MRSHHARLAAKAGSASFAPQPLPQSSQRMNFALAGNGGVASSSSNFGNGTYNYTAAGANNGVRSGANWGQGEGWHDGLPQDTFPDWLQIDFSGSKTIDEIDVFTVQDNWQYPSEPTEAMTFSLYGLTGFDVQYWTGSTWLSVSGGNVTNNNKVWKKITFTAITTNKIRVLTNASTDGHCRITEVEAWGPATSRTNVALASNGGVASSSSNFGNGTYNYTAAGANNGVRSGANWGQGEGWHDGLPQDTFPDWLQIDFSGSKTIDEIDVFTVQDNWQYPSEPTEAMTFSLYGLTGFDVQYWNGSTWLSVSGGNVTNNNKVWKKITFTAITTNKIRVLTNASTDGHCRITEVEAWDAPATGTGSSPSEFAKARLDPKNRTGTGGEDLLSNNFNWSLPLVSLPGRSGLDLGLTLSYNSLVWTRSANYLTFDPDLGSIAPGFRLGFPTIEGPFWNSDASANFYLLVSPSGGRVELRQIGNSIVYEAKDSSYLQLIDNLNGTMTLRPADGSQMNFIGVSGAWRCHLIKDRNGNYITATYKHWGELETVTDTLGRVLTFNYDGNSNVQSITQSWGGQTAPREWATFGWGTATIGNNFPGLTNLGPNSTTIPVLTQVGLPDGSRYNFEYNNGFGMVSKVRHHASDNRLRRQTTYVAPANSSDCPRLSERRDWAENWNGDTDENPTTNEEVVTYFGHDADSGCRMTRPDGTVHKEYYGSSWRSGLTIETRSFAKVADANSNAWQKKTTTAWTQDNSNVPYLTNPRVTETNVYDSSGNRRRTTIDYGVYAQWGLPYVVKEYAADGSTELRRTQTDYNLSQQYLDRRILGLVSANQVYDAVRTQWLTKVTYTFDATGINSQAATAVMHDQNYNASFTVRGNVTGISRWDVTDINNAAKALTTTATYNAAGSMLSTTDPATHTNSLSYTESFSDGNNSRNAFAYPTTLTDGDGFQSLIQYNFDSGVITRTQGPPPAGQPHGRIQTMLYDNALRLTRVTTENNSAYTRYVYGSYYVQTFSTVNTATDEAYSCQVMDGHGRAYAVSGNHPNSSGGYRAQMTKYDIMGRPKQSTNPAEVTSGWVPTGDDAAGWQWNNPTEYDWQGRPLKTHNMDGTYKEASYSGCGCAGGEVVTLTDEVGRQQKVYSDVMGRTWKTEVMTWPDANDNRSVYSSSVSVFTARDQVSHVRQYAGVAPAEASSTNSSASCPTGTCQETWMTFDGYGRVQSKHVPEQNPGTATVYAYNVDDTIQSVTDARGASATYGYNNRHLVTSISYSAPTGITPTPNVTFGFDAAGNRTSMNDGVGTQSYTHNQLSQMTSETRVVTGVGNYRINYDYNLAGQLKSVTDPADATVSYGFDNAGRVSAVTGSLFGGVTSYASELQYRAWGAVKHLDYGNARTMDVGYNTRLQAASFSIPGVMTKSYSYHNDGRLSFSSNAADHRFDRSYAFDHAGRMTQALSGAEARGEPATNDRPYNETFNYDALNHLTSRQSRIWTWQSPYSIPETYTNNRSSFAAYDADGNQTGNSDATYSFDAAGNIATVAASDSQSSTTRRLDGHGQQVKTVTSTFNESSQTWESTTKYYIHSTVLGGKVLTELKENGSKDRTFVYLGGQVLATQKIIPHYETQLVTWEHRDPSDASYRTTITTGDVHSGGELDPTGAETISDPIIIQPDPEEGNGSLLSYPSFGSPTRPGTSYQVDGIPVSIDYFARVLEDNYHGSFSGGSLRSSIIGVRFSGSRLGRPYSESIYGNGRHEHREGLFDSSLLSNPLPSTSTLIYGSSLSIGFNLLSQNPAPITVRYMNQKYVKDFLKALGEAEKRLVKEECAKLFGKSSADLINLLENTEYRVLTLLGGGPKVDPQTGKVSVRGAQTNSPTSVFINAKGPFFNPVMLVPGKSEPQTLDFGSGLRGAEFGALLLLHELGHQTGVFKADAADPELNLKYTKRVLKDCF